MVDYSERRTGTANRPKKQGVASYIVLTALGCLIAGYGLGFASSWFLLKPSRQELNALRAGAERVAKAAPAVAPPPPQAPATGPADPNLSFYNTLPSGKALLGTGLNPAKPEPALPRPGASLPPAGSGSSPSASALHASPPPAPQEHRESPPQEKAQQKSPASTPLQAVAPTSDSSGDQQQKVQLKGKYVVQIASYQSKSEALAVKARLQDAGISAYVVESVLKDKGTMYRVRVGKNLDPAAAAELAVKAGKNAIVILE